MIVLSGAQVAALVARAGFPDAPVSGVSTRAIMVAISRAESGYQVDALDPDSGSGLFKIHTNTYTRYDQRQLLSDPEYATVAAFEIYRDRGPQAWTSFTNGGYLLYLNEARLALTQAAVVVGAAELPAAGVLNGVTGIGFGTPTGHVAPVGSIPPANSADIFDPIRIIGSEMWADYATLIIGTPRFEAGIETIPNLKFTIIDPEGALLLRHSNVLVRGSRVQYLDMDLRIDQIGFEPGGHGSGQITVTAIHDIAYRLMNLTGAASAGGISATQWLARELSTLGYDPAVYMLGEALTSQAQVSRDVADQQGTTGNGQAPSAWTTMTRLGRELGRRFFLSGSKAVFGSSAFAMRWTAYGSLQLSWDNPPTPGEQWLNMPSSKATGSGDRANITEVTGRVPLNRAKFFRPGVSVKIRNTPSVAGDEWREFICSHVAYGIGTDVDGADITLLEPVDPPPQPPGSTGGNTGGAIDGGADGQIDRFVSIALQQAGKRYVFGAEASPSDPNPAAFDCSELVEWAAARANISPRVPDGSANQLAHCRSHNTLISVPTGVSTKGALLFQPGHVAISLGNGKTIEAMNPSQGTRQGNANGRGWTAAGKIPGAQGYR